MTQQTYDDELDCSGMNCPLPVLKTKMKIDEMTKGAVLLVSTTDPGSCKDMPAWASRVGHKIVDSGEVDGRFLFYVQKGE